ncbi:thiamine-phosphate kinase [Pseudoalteromonas denitrificans DSM 6059]|uniref:Thiamine-monophosphate kinase n=1 Tax=Pseudoalteromonas denitrificans DSM 6059 TaxID=1123010 RepID=A0A1I1E263_9GAMM|nr:thiamine-phosphate kinase [Pseudoalteromonas denitrificans DSM 6059]
MISRFFKNNGITRKDVNLGIGDDGAVVTIPDNCQLVVTTDTLVSGVHFFPDMDPRALGHRALAVNLSDLAAMGAEPAWISLALTLPKADIHWLEEFTAGMHEIAEYFNVQIIGGDTTQGPLTISVCAKGTVPTGKALTRSGAKNGDWIYVSGPLGDSGVAIEAQKGKHELTPRHLATVKKRFEYPSPRVAAGQVLRGLASAAIDISDGLLADLQHILDLSGVSATINVDKVPVSDVLKEALTPEEYLPYVLSYGDDYELLFTVPEDNKGMLEINLKQYGVDAVCIGQIKGSGGEIELLNNEANFEFRAKGYKHFS